MKQNNKAGLVVATNSGSKPKNFNQRGHIFQNSGFRNYAENPAQKQAICHLCAPQVGDKVTMAVNLCGDCETRQMCLENELLAHLAKPRRVIRLHRCAACQNAVVPAKFSRDWGICKACVADVVSKSKLARSNFVERAVNNFRKMLKGVAAL